MKKAYVIVDGYSSGRLLVDSFKEKFKDDPDVAIVHVQSTPTPYTSMAVPEFSKYEENIAMTGSLDEVLEALKKYEVVAVIAGQEPGVEFADTLSAALNLKTSNGVEKSSARRNKFDMVQMVAESKLEAPKFLKSSNLSEVISWVNANTTYPVVIKALRSAGTDGVYICGNESELLKSFEKLKGSESIYREVNNQVLVESFLKGDEFVVNSVSSQGKHFVTDVWMYKKKFIAGHGYIYDREMLVPSESKTVQDLTVYNNAMLTALGIDNGPSHAEIMYTPNGPAIVEVGARLSGVVHRTLNTECLGHNQVDLTRDCYADPEKFMQTVSQFPYRLKNHGMVVNLDYDGLPGTVERVDSDVLQKIKSLPSVKEVIVRAQPGSPITPTRTLVNSPARIFLTHADSEQVERDYQEIQVLKRRLFRVAPQPSQRPPSPVTASPVVAALAHKENVLPRRENSLSPR